MVALRRAVIRGAFILAKAQGGATIAAQCICSTAPHRHPARGAGWPLRAQQPRCAAASNACDIDDRRSQHLRNNGHDRFTLR